MINKSRFQHIRFAVVFGLILLPFHFGNVYAESGSSYETIEWTDLMPPLDLEAFRNPPEYLNEIEDGSSQDLIGSEIDGWNSSDWNSPQDDPYQAALTSTRTVDEFNGKDVRVPGFIVPLEFDDDMSVTQFFLVPYFGACIHLPPPPPNQMVLVEYPEGLQLDSLYTPFWVSGQLSVQIVENELGTSAYAMQMESFEIYQP